MRVKQVRDYLNYILEKHPEVAEHGLYFDGDLISNHKGKRLTLKFLLAGVSATIETNETTDILLEKNIEYRE